MRTFASTATPVPTFAPTLTGLASAATPTLNRRQALALLAGGGAAGSGWAQSPDAAAHTARISGTGSGLGGMQLLAQAFMLAHPGTRIDVLPALGTTGGIRALIDSRIDLAVSNRAPTGDELAAGGGGLLAKAYARTPFVLAVHRNLGLAGVTGAQLVALYSEVTPQFANGKRARPVLRTSDKTDTQLMKALAPSQGTALAAAVDLASSRKGMLDANNDTDCADLIEQTPGAFGPSTLALIASESRPLVGLAIDGVAPTLANLVGGSYPHSKALHLVQASKSNALAQRFAAYVHGAAAQRILQGAGHAAA
jgi:phosphate transport system substrate-binding protein